MKSELLSMMDLLFAHDPNYRSIKFRRQYDEIMGAGSLWEKAEAQYKLFDAKPNKSDKVWTFPSGAKSFYRHMFLEGDSESHRGKAYSMIGFDEINAFSLEQVSFMQTCLRSEAKMDSFMVGTLNPSGQDNWTWKFIEWYIDMETGYPDQDKCGKVRYYLIIDGEPIFGPDEQFFIDNYYELVNPITNLETGERTYVRAKRFTFFFFNIFDNAIGMALNPQYMVELNTLPEHERQSQLFGSWTSQPKGVSMFSRSNLRGLDPKYPSTLPDINSRISCRGWDKAYKEPSEVYKYPDYSANIQMHKCIRTGELHITGNFHEGLHDNFKESEDIIYGRFRKSVGIRDQWMLQQALMDGEDCTVVIPKEGGAGAGEWEQMRRMFIEEGFTVHGAETGNKKGGKGLRFATFCSLVEQGMVHIHPETFPNKATMNAYLKELEMFDPELKSTGTRKDDWVDATSDCALFLIKKKTLNVKNLANAMSTFSTSGENKFTSISNKFVK